MQILRMAMFETNGTVENYIRPFQTDVRERSDIINNISQVTEGGRRVDSARLGRLASRIIVPSTNIIGSKIDNGWAQPRLMFAMAISATEGPLRKTTIHYITGYTDHNEYSESRGMVEFDPTMRLYFNNVTKVDVPEISVRGQRQLRPVVRSNDLMLLRDSVETKRDTRNSTRNNSPLLMRPYDVLSRRSGTHALAAFMDEPNASATVMTGSFTASTLMSSRDNNDSANYLSKTIDAFMKARSFSEDSAVDTGFYVSDESDDLFSSAGERLRETSQGQDSLFQALRMSDILDDGFITWEELLRMDPTFDPDRHLPFSPWKEQVKSHNDRRGRHTGAGKYTSGLADTASASSWSANSTESISAYMIAQSLPSLLTKCMYSKIEGLVLTTYPAFDEPKVSVGLLHPFINEIPVEYGYKYLTTVLEDVVIPNVTKNGLFDLEAMININIDQNIEIWLTIDGGPEEYFIFPAWAEHVIPPIITNDKDELDQLSSNIGSILEDLGMKISRENTRDIDQGTSVREMVRGRDRDRDRGHSRDREDVGIILPTDFKRDEPSRPKTPIQTSVFN